MEQRERLLYIDTALMGKWENEESWFLFEGMGIEGNLGEVDLFHTDTGLIEAHYKVFIKEKGVPYLMIISQINGKQVAWEYIINEIDSAKGILKLSTTLGKELLLKKSGTA